MKKIIIILSLIILSIVSVLYNKMCTLEKEINLLSYNQSLILCQVQDSEKEIVAVENDVDKLINKYSKQYGVNNKLAHAVAKVESNKQQNRISKSKAVGIYQVLPSTAKKMGENPYTIEGNIRSGIKYLAYLDKKYNGNTELILAGYNAGEGNVKKYGGVPPFKETKSYIQKVKIDKNIIK